MLMVFAISESRRCSKVTHKTAQGKTGEAAAFIIARPQSAATSGQAKARGEFRSNPMPNGEHRTWTLDREQNATFPGPQRIVQYTTSARTG
jgi:hypothetical protein